MQSRHSARRAALLSLVLLSAFTACSKNDPAQTVAPIAAPIIGDADVELAVVQKIEQRTDVVRANPGSARAWGDLGIVFDVHDLVEQSIRCYTQAEKLDPGDYQWPFFLGAANMRGDLEASRRHFKRAMELRSDYAPLPCYLGRLLFDAGDLPGARAAFDKALAVDDALIAAHLGIAQVDLAEGKPVEALERLEFALALGPTSTEIHAHLAEAHKALGNGESAEWHASLVPQDPPRELILDPVRRELLLREGVSLLWRRMRTEEFLRRNEPELVVAEWTKALAIDPENAALELEAGHAMLRIGRAVDAIAHYDRSIELDPQSGHALLGKGNALSARNMTAEAIEAFEEALEVNPTLNEARVNLGAMRMENGDPDAGIAMIEAACEAMPENADARYNLAKAYLALGREADSIDMMNEVIQLNPAHVRAHIDLGKFLIRSDLPVEASEQFRLVTALAPGLSEGYTLLSETYKLMAAPQRAAEVLAEGIERVEQNHELMYALAWILSTNPDDDLRDGERAIAIAKEACAVTRYMDPNGLQILGAAYAEVGDFERAISSTTTAQELLQQGMLTTDRRKFLIELQKRMQLYRENKPVRDAR